MTVSEDRRRRGHRWLAVAVLALWSSSAAAADRSVRLTYTRGPGADACPDEDAIRAGVAARLGYEPFDDGAATRVRVTVARAGSAFEARIDVADAAGNRNAERRLSSRRRDCAELVSALELAISIAIDPLGGARARTEAPQPPAPPAPLPPPAPAAAPAPPPPLPRAPATGAAVVARDNPPPPSVPLDIRARAGAVVTVGAAPTTTFGASVGASFRRRALSVGLEGQADWPVTAPLRVGAMQVSVLKGALLPCLHMGLFGGCLVAAAGSLRASGRDLVDAQHVTVPFMALGARLTVEVVVAGPLLVGVHGEVLAPLTETVLRVSGEVVWTSPPISGAAGLVVGARFP